MEVKDTLTAALKAVTDAEIPEDLREVAFAKAVDLLTGTAPVAPEGGRLRTEKGTAAPAGGQTAAAAGGGSVLDRIADKLGVGREAVEEVFAESDGSIEIVVPHSKFAKAKMPAAQELAILLAAGRQAGGIDERTSLDDIRTVCEDFKKLDTNNFSKAMNGMKDEFTFQGSGKGRGVKVTRPGWTKATELVKRLTGGAES